MADCKHKKEEGGDWEETDLSGLNKKEIKTEYCKKCGVVRQTVKIDGN